MIGRILYLGNNHIPPINDRLDSEYISFGYYDGIKISEDIFKNSSGKFDLPKIWVQSVRDVSTMKGGYSVQAMYLFNDDDTQRDDDFWNDKTFPCLFLIALQLNIRNTQLPDVREDLLENIRSYCNDKDHHYNMDIVGYYTLDENDILLAIKTDSYKLGRIITDSLHKKEDPLSAEPIHVSYSFTISGILKESLKAPNGIKDIPEECQWRIVERKPGAIEAIRDEIETKVGKVKIYPIFGRDDDLIVFKPGSWEQILSLYSPSGPFYNDTLYRERILSMSTLFLYTIEEKERIDLKKIYPPKEKNGTDITYRSICLALMDKIKGIYQNALQMLDNDHNSGAIQTENAYYKAIWQILNSVEKFEHNAFPDYIYVAIYSPLKMLVAKMVDMAKLRENWGQGHTRQGDEKGSEEIYSLSFIKNKGIHLFLDAIDQVSQNLIRAERQFMQAPKLNAGCYHIPVKLYAFYAAYVYKIVNYLNDHFGNDNSYEFMLYPGMNEQLRVKRIFYSPYDKNRLLLVEIPEKQIFNPKHMMITLCHEIGHFVGSRLRNRDERFECLKKAAGRMLVLYIFLGPDINEFITADALGALLEDLPDKINKAIDSEHKTKVKWNKDNVYVKEKHHDTALHSEYLEPIFISGINSFLASCLSDEKNLFEEAFIRYLIADPKATEASSLYTKKFKFLKHVKISAYDLQSTYVKQYGRTSDVAEIVRVLFNIIKEAFADLVSIMILQLTYKDYYGSIFSSMSVYHVKNLISSEAMIRMAIVTEAMVSNEGSPLGLYWDIRSIDEDRDNESDTELREFLNMIIIYHNRMVKEESAYDRLKDMGPDPILNVFWDKTLLNILVNYLSSCLLAFEKEITTEKKGQFKIDLDTIVNDTEMKEKIVYINNYIQEYKDQIRKTCEDELYP